MPVCAKAAVHLDEEQEHHGGCTKMPQCAVFILSVRVHHRQRRRQGFPAQVVIEHDDIGAFGCRKSLVAEGAAIDAEDQIMRLGWKVFIPVTIIWIGVEGAMAWFEIGPWEGLTG